MRSSWCSSLPGRAPETTDPICGVRCAPCSPRRAEARVAPRRHFGTRGMSGVAPLDDAPLPRQETPVARPGYREHQGRGAVGRGQSVLPVRAAVRHQRGIISRFFLQPEEVGLFSVALAGAMLFAVLQDFGLTRYLGAHPTAEESVVKSALVVAVLFAVALAALILGLAWPIAAFYGEMGLAPVLALIAGSYLLVPFSLIPLALLAPAEFRKTFAVNIAGAIAGSGAALGLAAAGFRPPRWCGR